MKYLLLLLSVIPLYADEGVPTWVINGIAKVETKSFWRNGELIYVDQRKGTHGERGPFQMLPDTFALIRKPGEYFSRLSYDMEFATNITIRYVQYLYQRCHSWERATAAYNGGPGNPRWSYERKVEIAAGVR